MVDLELENLHNTYMPNATPQSKKWYVFDQFDCLTNCTTAAAAAVEAEHYAGPGGMEGVHVVYMTQAQFDHYCTHNDLKQALQQK